MISSEISIALELHGISHVLSTGCTSSTDAIGYAASLIRAGEADVLLSGGADACVTPGMIFGFSKMRAVSTNYNDSPARPRGRSIAAATASCSAKARGWWCSSAKIAPARAAPTIYATIDGYGSTCDAYHRVQMDPDGEQIVRAMRLAIERSGRRDRGDRLRQLSRHVDAAERRHRSRAACASSSATRRRRCRVRRPSR